MKKAGKSYGFPKRGVCAWVLAFGVIAPILCLLANMPAYGDDDPFQLDSGHWMSSAHYQDASKRGTLDLPPPQEIPVANSVTAPVTTSVSAVAAPARPIDLPVMPGLNKGFDVHVTSTEDENIETPAPIIETDKSTDIHLSDKNWSSPKAAPSTQKNAKNDDDNDTPAPINVRMSFLPNAAVTPIPSPEHTSIAKLAHIALEKSIEDKNRAPAKTPSETAACAAIDAYKKQQLDAIQSDRQTLKALQDAISSLGLQKQLGFITGSNSNLSLSGSSNSSANMETNPATTVR